MADRDIHEPELPGVRTLGKDQAHDDDSLGISFMNTDRDTRMRAPEKTALNEPTGSILTNKDDVFNVSNAYAGDTIETGTIVTDKRHSRLSVGGMLKAAVTEWWGNTSQSLEKIEDKLGTSFTKPPRPTVADPETRKEVIEKAAQFTQQVPRDDHKVVIEKMKTLAHDAEQVTGRPYVIKQSGEEAAPAWGKPHIAEPATPAHAPTPAPRNIPTLDLRGSSIAPTVERRIENHIDDFSSARRSETAHTTTPSQAPRSVNVPSTTGGPRSSQKRESGWSFFGSDDDDDSVAIAPEVNSMKRAQTTEQKWMPTSAPTHPEARVAAHAPAPAGLPIMHEEPVPETLKVAVPIPAPAPAHVPQRAPEPIVREVSQSIPAQAPAPTPVVHSITRAHVAPQKPSRLVPALIFIVVLIVGAGGGIFAGRYVAKNRGADTELTAPVVVPALFAADRSVSIPLGMSRDDLMQALAGELAKQNSGITQLYPTFTDTQGNTVVATTEQILTVLSPRIDGRFSRALESTMMIGSVTANTEEPFIVLRAHDFDTAFAGMLDWEPFILEDLAPLFGPGNSATAAERFTDALSQNRSIRILYTPAGEERLIYAFVSRDTIVITTSTSALSAILSRI